MMMGSNKTKKKRRRFTAEFKQQAVELARTGKPVPEVARELGIGDGLLYGWVREAQAAQLGSGGLRAAGEEAVADELRRLRREVSSLRMENDILKKAAVIIGSSPRRSAAG